MKLEFNRTFENNSQCGKRHLCGNCTIVIHLSLCSSSSPLSSSICKWILRSAKIQKKNIFNETMQKKRKKATKITTTSPAEENKPTMNIKYKATWNIQCRKHLQLCNSVSLSLSRPLFKESIVRANRYYVISFRVSALQYKNHTHPYAADLARVSRISIELQ